MGCNKNEDCLRLANSVYPGYQGEINNEVSKITSELDNVISELNSLSVPDDYLGVKVKNSLTSIITDFNSDKQNVIGVSGNINTFIGRKKEEHQKHYNDWKRVQEELAKRKKKELEEQNK